MRLGWAAVVRPAPVVSLCQPAVAQAFPKAEAGRALSAFNLLIFLGVFSCQWGMGLAIDALRGAGLGTVVSLSRRDSALLLLACCSPAVWFWLQPRLRPPSGDRAARIIARQFPPWPAC